MKLASKLFILFILIANISYSQDWIKTDITDFASIDFPVKSELIKTQTETVFNAKDDVAFYVVSIRRLTDQQSSQITEEDIPTIYQGVTDGAIAAANGELVSIEEIYIQKIPAVELEYNTQSNPELPNRRFKRIIYIDQHIINIDFWPLTNQTETTNEKKAKYFNSFLINSIENASIAVNEESDIYRESYNIGMVIGQIFFYIILIGFLIGLFFLIRNLIKKNGKKKSPMHNEPKSSVKVTKIICQHCNSENKSDTKYCSNCGYELRKN